MPKESKAWKSLQKKDVGDKLTAQEGKELYKKCIKPHIDNARTRRRGFFLVHNRLQNLTGELFNEIGWDTEFEVAYLMFGEESRFDLIATKGRKVLIIEIKDVVDQKAIGQIHMYANQLQRAKEKAQLYLGTDLLNFENLATEGSIAEAFRELMVEEEVGVIFVDNDPRYMLICDNISQLVLDEMPEVITFETEEE